MAKSVENDEQMTHQRAHSVTTTLQVRDRFQIHQIIADILFLY